MNSLNKAAVARLLQEKNIKKKFTVTQYFGGRRPGHAQINLKNIFMNLNIVNRAINC